MISGRVCRIIVALAGCLGACGVILAAAAAHKPGAGILLSASSMLLFHALAALAAAMLAERRIVRPIPGTVAACGFILGAALFASDLTVLQFMGHRLFPMAAPTGGTLMIVSWLTLAVAALLPDVTRQ